MAAEAAHSPVVRDDDGDGMRVRGGLSSVENAYEGGGRQRGMGRKELARDSTLDRAVDESMDPRVRSPR